MYSSFKLFTVKLEAAKLSHLHWLPLQGGEKGGGSGGGGMVHEKKKSIC